VERKGDDVDVEEALNALPAAHVSLPATTAGAFRATAACSLPLLTQTA
jgi:hypothetical protein